MRSRITGTSAGRAERMKADMTASMRAGNRLANVFGLCTRDAIRPVPAKALRLDIPSAAHSNLERFRPPKRMTSASLLRRSAWGLLLLLGLAAMARGEKTSGRVVLQLPYTHQFQFAGV